MIERSDWQSHESDIKDLKYITDLVMSGGRRREDIREYG